MSQLCLLERIARRWWVETPEELTAAIAGTSDLAIGWIHWGRNGGEYRYFINGKTITRDGKEVTR